jgi:hypothetical protein
MCSVEINVPPRRCGTMFSRPRFCRCAFARFPFFTSMSGTKAFCPNRVAQHGRRGAFARNGQEETMKQRRFALKQRQFALVYKLVKIRLQSRPSTATLNAGDATRLTTNPIP